MIGIINSGVANVGSVANMLKKIGVDKVAIVSRPDDLAGVDKFILPGVGSFDAAARNLESTGVVPGLRERVVDQGAPLLGICLGMHLLGAGSEEGTHPGLRWIAARAVRFRQGDIKVPHMGWNVVRSEADEPLLEGLAGANRFYFVHSYYLQPEQPSLARGWTQYGAPFVSMIRQGNICGVQFHPEKSHHFGMKLLKNFLERC